MKITTPLQGGVVGIDLSLTSTGVAHIGRDHSVELFNYGRKGKRDEPLDVRADRIITLSNDIIGFALSGSTPELAVIESPSFGSSGGSAHDRAGAWWLVVTRLQLAGVPVAQVAPTTRAKYAAGSGRAGKDVVMAHLGARIPHAVILNDDQADALALAAMGARHLGFPVELGDLPSDNLKSMESVKWPLSI